MAGELQRDIVDDCRSARGDMLYCASTSLLTTCSSVLGDFRHGERSSAEPMVSASVVDLFCGAGGLTHGFLLEGLNVVAGIDSDPTCKYPYEINNLPAKFHKRDVAKIRPCDVRRLYPRGDVRVLAGCAPCQPFSTFNQGKIPSKDGRWGLLYHFARLIRKTKPEIVTMENVPRLQKEKVYEDFLGGLKKLGYHLSERIVFSADYGVPQRRRRLVLLGSLLGPIDLIPATHSDKQRVTVRQKIEGLERLNAGEKSARDSIHVAAGLSATNLLRIRASLPGRSWRDWDETLVAACHRKESGETYSGVYGRMAWDEIGPTITTECFAFGSGRFGHPEQDRAITLREAALLQTFPTYYEFVKEGEPVYFKVVGRLVGNAVPVELARAIARSIKKHLEENVG